jgi:hypothetical protein
MLPSSTYTNLFQERNISDGAELICSGLKENTSEQELEIINLQADLWLKTRMNDKNVGI